MAFHLYPQLIPQFCHIDGFEPPFRYYQNFTLAMGSSPGFGSNPCNSNALFGLAFAAAPQLKLLNLATYINSPAHSSIGTPSPDRNRALTVCRHAVSGLFHSPSGVLFTFPSRYLFTIGRQEYLALESGLPRFPQGSTCPVVLKNMAESLPLSSTGLSPSMVAHSRDLRLGLRFVTLCSYLGRNRPRLTTPW